MQVFVKAQGGFCGDFRDFGPVFSQEVDADLESAEMVGEVVGGVVYALVEGVGDYEDHWESVVKVYGDEAAADQAAEQLREDYEGEAMQSVRVCRLDFIRVE